MANLFGLLLFALFACQTQQSPAAAKTTFTIKAEQNVIIWVDNLHYGTVGTTREMTVKNLAAGTHTVRARLTNFREFTKTVRLAASLNNQLEIEFKQAATAAEILFQEAETLREQNKHKDAIAKYQAAIANKTPLLTRARIGLSRSLAATNEYAEAIEMGERAAREAKINPSSAAEAFTVVANTYRAQGLYDEAFANYERALKLARNISPEAHTGLALTYQEENKIPQAIQHLQQGAEQSNDTEPIIYYLLGNLLDREGQIKLAIAAYEKFLSLDPVSKFATTTRSMLKQLQREAKMK